MRGWNGMSENGILANIFRMGDQVKRNLRDFAGNPGDYLDNIAHQNNIEWKKDPIERSMGFFNPVPLGNVSPFMLRKQMKEAIDELPSLSRRDFMKKSAGIAAGSTVGAGVTAKLLRKFAPEEKQVLKEGADTVAQTIKELPKHKYNSLKEYLDDVTIRAEGDILGSGNAFSDSLRSEGIKYRLQGDELAYNNAKWAEQNAAKYPHEYQPRDRETLNMLSPQAKKEMKELKTLSQDLHVEYGGNPAETPWVDWLANHPEDPGRVLESLRGYKKMSLDSIPF